MATVGCGLLILAHSARRVSWLTCLLELLTTATQQLGPDVSTPRLSEIGSRKVRGAARAHGSKVTPANRPDDVLRAEARPARAIVPPNDGAKA